MKRTAVFILAFLGALVQTVTAQWQWQRLATGASFRSMHVVSEQTIWAGGTEGTVARTTDGGKSWQIRQVPEAEKLDFRGIQAASDSVAWVMSAGDADKGAARIYKTTDAGQTWRLVFQTQEKGVFLDCLRMKDTRTGYVVGDALGNKPYILKTTDGGEIWQLLDTRLLPAANEGEASYAASNSNIAIKGSRVWIATQERVFYSPNEGGRWVVYRTPFTKGPTSGIFGLYPLSENHLLAVGGDFKNDTGDYLNLAMSRNAGRTWRAMPRVLPQGLKESVWQRADGAWVAVGTSGSGISKTKGATWEALGKEPFHVVQCAGNTCYAIGAKGFFAKLPAK